MKLKVCQPEQTPGTESEHVSVREFRRGTLRKRTVQQSGAVGTSRRLVWWRFTIAIVCGVHWGSLDFSIELLWMLHRCSLHRCAE